MHPDAEPDTFHQGRWSKQVEFDKAKRIRINAELHQVFERLGSRERTLLAHRIRQDVADNGVDPVSALISFSSFTRRTSITAFLPAGLSSIE